jgi:hypothetical protein
MDRGTIRVDIELHEDVVVAHSLVLDRSLF